MASTSAATERKYRAIDATGAVLQTVQHLSSRGESEPVYEQTRRRIDQVCGMLLRLIAQSSPVINVETPARVAMVQFPGGVIDAIATDGRFTSTLVIKLLYACEGKWFIDRVTAQEATGTNRDGIRFLMASANQDILKPIGIRAEGIHSRFDDSVVVGWRFLTYGDTLNAFARQHNLAIATHLVRDDDANPEESVHTVPADKHVRTNTRNNAALIPPEETISSEERSINQLTTLLLSKLRESPLVNQERQQLFLMARLAVEQACAPALRALMSDQSERHIEAHPETITGLPIAFTADLIRVLRSERKRQSPQINRITHAFGESWFVARDAVMRVTNAKGSRQINTLMTSFLYTECLANKGITVKSILDSRLGKHIVGWKTIIEDPKKFLAFCKENALPVTSLVIFEKENADKAEATLQTNEVGPEISYDELNAAFSNTHVKYRSSHAARLLSNDSAGNAIVTPDMSLDGYNWRIIMQGIRETYSKMGYQLQVRDFAEYNDRRRPASFTVHAKQDAKAPASERTYYHFGIELPLTSVPEKVKTKKAQPKKITRVKDEPVEDDEDDDDEIPDREIQTILREAAHEEKLSEVPPNAEPIIITQEIVKIARTSAGLQDMFLLALRDGMGTSIVHLPRYFREHALAAKNIQKKFAAIGLSILSKGTATAPRYELVVIHRARWKAAQL